MSNLRFWDDHACGIELRQVLFKPDLEDSVRNAWTNVVQNSYPRLEVIHDETVLWKVQRELWPRRDGRSDLDLHKPAAIVVRCVRLRQQAAVNAATGDAQPVFEFDRFTWLIIEVKRADQDTAENWIELLLQACSRAKTGYDTGAHDVYIICAVGLNYMLFSWDPTNVDVSSQELRIDVAGENTHFESQLKPVPECSPHLPKLQVAGDPDQYQIDLCKVWSIDPRQIDAQGRAPESFTSLEGFLARTRTVGLSNPRPVFD